MTEAALPTLVLVAVAAVVAPILAELSRGLRVPSVVIELLLGILMGPFVLNIAHPNGVITALSDMGLTFLMFMAGFELDLKRIKGSPLNLGVLGWFVSLGIALAFAFALVSSGLALDTLVVGLALTTTALGTLLPILGDAGVLTSPFGAYVVGIGTAGEFGPVVAVAVLLTQKDPRITIPLLLGFVVIAVVTALLAMRAHPPKLVALLRRHLHTSSQLPVRVCVLLVLLLVYLAFELGLDVLLGAFAAGIVVRLFTRGDDSEVIESKLEAIGFGFLIPVFFVVSGVHFDLHILLTRPSALLRLALFLALMLIVRGTPVVLLYRRVLSRAERVPLVFLSATGLPLIVVITTIGTSEGRMLPENAAALVGAGMLSVLLFPALSLSQLRKLAPAAAVVGATPLEPLGGLEAPAAQVEALGGLEGPAADDSVSSELDRPGDGEHSADLDEIDGP
jgi:Kef-type K+ transport system membrane component KefB